jgi:broad specificity phosphatase PhoE
MTSVLLIRHATHDAVNTKIFGRTPGIRLNRSGKQQAEQLARRLSVLPVDAIFCGPLERARETAEPLARTLDLPLQIADDFDELDMGEWTNRTLNELESIPEWHQWNTQRATTIPPGGESMSHVQARVLTKIAVASTESRCFAIFTHGDVIRAALAHFLGLHLDLLFRFQVDCGSVSVVQMHGDRPVVRMLNWVPIRTISS